MKFTIEGTEGIELPGGELLIAKRMKAALEATKPGTLWTVDRLRCAVKCSPNHAQFVIGHSDFSKHRAKSGVRYFYGSPETIRQWKLASAKS